jgi:RecA/RadA recombinase
LTASLIERQFGKGSIMRLGRARSVRDRVDLRRARWRSTIALGIGGLPRGRVVEIYGPESSGKTTLTLHVIAEAQKRGGICAFIDAEHALDVQYARKLGRGHRRLLVSQPDSGEQALEIADMLVRSTRSTSSSSTRWRRWCPRPSSKARWATARRPAGAADVAGAAQADGTISQVAHDASSSSTRSA